MISLEEIKRKSNEYGVPISVIEKDYVNSWFLKAIYSFPSLVQNLILKGGNSIRKAYFSDTRFSNDLDFTAIDISHDNFFRDYIGKISEIVENEGGIIIDHDKTNIDKKDTSHGMDKAFDIRYYFVGIEGNTRLTLKIKFDVSDYERIFLPTQNCKLNHIYSDNGVFSNLEIKAYSIEEIIAEKLRSWIQRTNPHDLFDIVKIIQKEIIPISRANVISTFFKKSIYKEVPLAGKEELLSPIKFSHIESAWSKGIVCSDDNFISFDTAKELFTIFVNSLFRPEVLTSIGLSSTADVITTSDVKSIYDIGSGNREAIIKAGKSMHLITMKYKDVDRIIEPYSFKYRVTNKGVGSEYFYGFDRTQDETRKPSIKSFLLHKIQSVSIMSELFIPQWDVEF